MVSPDIRAQRVRAQLLKLAIASALLALLGVAFLDKPIALWVHAHEQSGVWNAIVGKLEYAIGIEPWTYLAPAVLVAGFVATLVVAHWRPYARAWGYVAVVYLVTRNLMGWAKVVFGRLRPHQWADVGGSTFGFIGKGASFPSGHVVVFGAILLPLAVVAPRTRPLLLIVPFIMIARIAVQAHFLSDVCAGLALTALVSWACVPLLTWSARAGAASSAPPPASRRG